MQIHASVCDVKIISLVAAICKIKERHIHADATKTNTVSPGVVVEYINKR